MEKRISDFVKLKEQLVSASIRYLDSTNPEWDGSLEEKDILETRLNEAVKTLSKDELSEIIEKDLKTCVDRKTADPLSWICGIRLDELPMSFSLAGSSIGVEYSYGVRIGIELDYCRGLCFSVNHKDCSCRSDFNLCDMDVHFCRILDAAEYIKVEVLGEDEELIDEEFKGVFGFNYLKEALVDVSHDCLVGRNRYEEREILKALLDKTLKNLSADELTEIIKTDLRACVDNETADPLLWICGIDPRALPKGIVFGTEYSPDLWVCLGRDANGLYFSVDGKGISCYKDFDMRNFTLYDMKQAFSHILDRADLHELTIKESLAEPEEQDEER